MSRKFVMANSEITTVLIVGGGLGGLALAQLLLQDGPSNIKVLVFERDAHENVREQGYCIGLDAMGLNVLKQIRVLDNILSDHSDAVNNISGFRLVSRKLKTWFTMNANGCKLIYRADLRRALLTNINVQWNKRFTSYKIVDNQVEACFEDGYIARGTILIGCDGANSLVRAHLLPNFKRDDLAIWTIGGTVDKNEGLPIIQQLTHKDLVRIFGKQGYSLLLLDFRQSWMWALSWPENGNNQTELNITSAQLVAKARTYFDNAEIVRLFELPSSSSSIGPYRLYSSTLCKVNPFPNNSHVTLLGDAGHSMTTHAGKGANTTFADALDLAQALRSGTLSSLADYEQKMFERGFAAVRVSLRSTTMIHSTGWQALLRDCIFSVIHCTLALINVLMMPFRWNKKQHD